MTGWITDKNEIVKRQLARKLKKGGTPKEITLGRHKLIKAALELFDMLAVIFI